MRILWFTNTPSLATEKLTGQVGVGGGWVDSLEEKFAADPTIQLALAFRWKVPAVQSFPSDHSDTRYYLLHEYPQGKWSRLWWRHTARIEPPRELADFMEVIRDFKLDMIHIFGTEQGFGRVATATTLPVVVWIQGNLTVYTRKYFSGISKWDSIRYSRLIDLLKGNSYWQEYLQALKIARREREIFLTARHFIGRTDWDRRLTKVLAPQATYHHCDDMIRPAFHQMEWESHTERGKFILLSTIRENLYKGLETILESAVLLKGILGPNFEWGVAGIAPQSQLARIVRKQLGLRFEDYQVNLLGNLTPDGLTRKLLAVDIFVHPSHIDNAPNSVQEAMLLGIPVVSTNSGGTGSLLKDNQEGLLVQDGDPWALAGAILELIRDPERAAALGRQARKRGLVRNNPDVIYQDLIRIYQHLLEAKKTYSTNNLIP